MELPTFWFKCGTEGMATNEGTYHLSFKGPKGALVWMYLDDFLVIAPLADLSKMHTGLLVDLLFRMGIQFPIAKSMLTPTKSPTKAGVLIPSAKMQSLIKDMNRLLRADLPACRRCSTLLGRLSSYSSRHHKYECSRTHWRYMWRFSVGKVGKPRQRYPRR